MFSYPLDCSYLLRKKKSIKKELLSENRNFLGKNIAILGGSTTSEIKNILELFLLKNGIKPNFYESNYNKYYEDALFGNKEFNNFKPDIILIHTSNVNIDQYPSVLDNEETINKLLETEIQKFKSIWKSLEKYNCAIIQNNFDFPIDRNLGNLDCYDIHGITHFINQLNQEFAKASRKQVNLYINDINYLSSYIGLEKWFDKSLWYKAKYALSMQSIPELSFNLSKIINSIFGNTKKCLVLDLDNTCWGGVIGDDGINGIKIGKETALGEAFLCFQEYVKQLKIRGVSLAACSKNDLTNAIDGFTHPDSVLNLEDFNSFKANWESKDQNIIEIAKEINIGIDSLVFIDDNPVERDIVKSQIMSISVPNVGSDIVQFIDHLDKNGFFEPVSLSLDDINRNKYYQDNKKRIELKETYASYDDFLISLKMEAEIGSFDAIHLDRITQLTNKTNQFNLTNKRYTLGEISSIANNDDYIKIYGKLFDKYGSNGLIAISIGHIVKKICHIDLWLMSCRVLKRNMEFAMLDEMVRQCRLNNVSKIIGYYNKSPKNNMVKDLFSAFGFKLISKSTEASVWELDIIQYVNRNQHIGVKVV